MTEQLPPYPTLPQPEPESPQYTLPETFNIGRRSTQHLVRPDQLKAHLQLLAAFSHLKQQVVASESLVAGLESDSEKRWVWFVNMAVERFERWCWTIKQYDTVEQRLPPIDVTMVWHAYLLNPSWYAEDTARISKLIPLTHFTDYFPNLLANPDLLTTDAPRHERVSAWERLTKSPYDPFASAADLTHKSIKCPYCDRTILSPFLQSNGMGYAQSNFSVKCECAGLITKELLGLYKFAKNIVEGTAPDKYLAGTLHTPLSTYDTRRGDTIKKRVLSSHLIFKKKNASNPVRQILINVRYDATRMRTVLNKHLKPRLLNKIMGAYTDDRVFSLDLVGAVLRQASFVEKMDNLGWTEPGYFVNEVDTVVLQHCTARYHAFLNIMAESPASFFVPTLDIDLAWHTHQLMARRYVNHDDKVEEGQLATSFDITCRAWNVSYFLWNTTSPLNSLNRRTVIAYPTCTAGVHCQETHRSKTPTPPLSQTTSNVLLLPPKSDARAATHPSDHNAVFALHNMSAACVSGRTARARQRCGGCRQSGTGGLKRDGDVDHGIAFLYPVPMFYYYPGGCVAAAGAVVNGGLGCAAVSVVVFG
ncbi:uncharacterized protein BJ212DRAFT_1401921 [Suillus subaureus]|uniref:Uncharacterized protein n=1 Tax=Suillus subaureus TaxID=48587 RepID=A0A9P7J1W3_9AGAM|nr:uncharacterized protein BJ212DRAFT_1401921 [Suillus subaureus]KAG1799566.1 hypothetical protein BJ212DRAFT_1401921 [Suillus subaureus]